MEKVKPEVLVALVGVILLAVLGRVDGAAVLTFLVGLGLKSPLQNP
ncbi:MAG: hypothetical protein AB1679_14365 [Actinomycetota bacterium]|jgi:hypothetical protein